MFFAYNVTAPVFNNNTIILLFIIIIIENMAGDFECIPY